MRPFTLLFAGFLLLSTGCVQHFYSPNFVQTPFIQKKGDGIVTVAISGSPVSVNGDFHASFSPVKQGTVMINYFRSNSSFEDTNFFSGPTYTKKSNGYLVEGALGAYMPIAFGTGALYIGYGQGQIRNDYDLGRIAELGLQRFFVQPTYTFKNKWFRLGMGLRLVRLNYPYGKIDYRIEPIDIETIKRLERKSGFWFPELGGTVGFHIKPVTISTSLVLVGFKAAAEYGFDTSNLGMGLSFELHEMFKNRKK